MAEKFITTRAGGNYEVSKFINDLKASSREEFFKAIDELGKVGEKAMREKIERTPSDYSQSGLKALLGFSQGGRIKSGDMYKSVASRPRGKGKLYQAEVGYLKGYKKYFRFQERGFYNIWQFFGFSRSGKSYGPNATGGAIFRRRQDLKEHFVKGIFALKDARQKMEDNIIPIMNRAAARIDRREAKK